jgi:hypothetical protein
MSETTRSIFEKAREIRDLGIAHVDHPTFHESFKSSARKPL